MAAYLNRVKLKRIIEVGNSYYGFSRINRLAALTGFSYNNMCGRFCRDQKCDSNNEVTVTQGFTIMITKKKDVLKVDVFVN